MRSSRASLIAAAALAVGTALLYARSLGGAFLNWDDDRFITANHLFQEGGAAYLEAALTRIQFDAYHPIHLVSYLPDRWLWKDVAAGYHAVSVAIFVADALLLYALARRRGAGAPAGALAAALFAAHPLCVESVAWISSRKDVLALLWFLAALLVEDRRDPRARAPSIAGLALFAAALLTKTSTVCFPPVLFAWLVWLRGAGLKSAALRAAPYAALAAAASVAVVTVWTDHAMIPPTRPAHPIVDVAATIATYARRVLGPHDLSPIYPEAAPHATTAAALLGAIAIAVAVAWRRLPGAARFAAIAFVAALLPVANVVPVVFRFADRYALLALATLVVPIAIGLDRALARPRARAPTIAAAGALAIATAIATLNLQGAWRDSRALWAHAVSAQPTAYLARLKRGETLRDAGRFEAAVAEYQAAIRLDPRRPLAFAGLLHAYARRAEADGTLPAGTADRWLAELGPAMVDERAFTALVARVPREACAPCSNTLLLVGLVRWPKPDAALLDAARAALDRGAVDAALIYLSQVRDLTHPDAQDLAARAAERLR